MKETVYYMTVRLCPPQNTAGANTNDIIATAILTHGEMIEFLKFQVTCKVLFSDVCSRMISFCQRIRSYVQLEELRYCV